MHFINYDKQNELFHHGVKGMKWGVRKDVENNGPFKTLAKDIDKAYGYSYKGDSELRKARRGLKRAKKRYEKRGDETKLFQKREHQRSANHYYNEAKRYANSAIKQVNKLSKQGYSLDDINTLAALSYGAEPYGTGKSLVDELSTIKLTEMPKFFPNNSSLETASVSRKDLRKHYNRLGFM